MCCATRYRGSHVLSTPRGGILLVYSRREPEHRNRPSGSVSPVIQAARVAPRRVLWAPGLASCTQHSRALTLDKVSPLPGPAWPSRASNTTTEPLSLMPTRASPPGCSRAERRVGGGCGGSLGPPLELRNSPKHRPAMLALRRRCLAGVRLAPRTRARPTRQKARSGAHLTRGALSHNRAQR